ncbi:tRNA-dihydrouridine synthase [Candidatus Woesebacteria bacterium]|nr:tRNA-dihydrouridine synthase [Candidatus Woesebacteria bacterium]
MSFWDDLYTKKKLVFGLSPMDGVTDAAMRYMTAKYGKPDLLFSEFVSVDALKHAKEEKSVDRVMRAFIKASDVGPLEHKSYEIAQVFGHTPELFYQAAVMIATLGFDGMDINMGCPAHKVEEQGSGAGLIRFPEIAQEIVRQSKQAMIDFSEGRVTVDDLDISPMTRDWVKSHSGSKVSKGILPVSVKTRIGVDKIVVEEWMETLMEVKPANISLHGRTLKQLYQGSADWEAIGRATEIVHKHGGHLLGNGDIASLSDLLDKARQYKVDGGLIGRCAEGNPEIFIGSDNPSIEQRKAWMVEHAQVYEKIFGEDNFMPMRKHLAWYCKGFPGAVEVRSKLMQTNNSREVEEIIKEVV